MHWRLAPAQTTGLREAMELFLFKGGYGGLSLIEEEQANLCLVVKRTRLRKLGGWDPLFGSILGEVPHLARRLVGAAALWERPLAVSPIPYGYLAGRPGLWCVGDQAAVIPSFTGDGMSIALHSASLAARMFMAGQTPEQYHKTLRNHLGRNMRLSTFLSKLMVGGVGRALAPSALSLMPASLRWIADATRIPAQGLIDSANEIVAATESALFQTVECQKASITEPAFTRPANGCRIAVGSLFLERDYPWPHLRSALFWREMAATWNNIQF